MCNCIEEFNYRDIDNLIVIIVIDTLISLIDPILKHYK